MKTRISAAFAAQFFALSVSAHADTWEQRFPSGTPPVGRRAATTVWTGTELIVWGGHLANGSNQTNTGSRYSPSTNKWTAVTTAGAPAARQWHMAVWTGSEMIVWGGLGNPVSVSIYYNTGGRYNPATNTWTPMSTVGAPDARTNASAVWTGTEMILWGGVAGGSANTGGRYNPTTDTWMSTNVTGAPTGRVGHSGIWTGTEMIIWGGETAGSIATATGGRYNPASNTWRVTETSGAPQHGFYHNAVWTGAEMLLSGNYLPPTGGRYNPASDSWMLMSADGAPAVQYESSAVWTGNEMIVWGGEVNTGARYDPSLNRWAVTTTTGAPAARRDHSAVWTGSEMIIWGGGTNYRTINGRLYIDHFTDTLCYTPGSFPLDEAEFRITSIVLEGGNILVSFPGLTDRSYTLWQSDTMAAGTWTDTGLPALPGTGAALTFIFPVEFPGRRFFRVQADR